jgi:hypothetical protein
VNAIEEKKEFLVRTAIVNGRPYSTSSMLSAQRRDLHSNRGFDEDEEEEQQSQGEIAFSGDRDDTFDAIKTIKPPMLKGASSLEKLDLNSLKKKRNSIVFDDGEEEDFIDSKKKGLDSGKSVKKSSFDDVDIIPKFKKTSKDDFDIASSNSNWKRTSTSSATLSFLTRKKKKEDDDPDFIPSSSRKRLSNIFAPVSKLPQPPQLGSQVDVPIELSDSDEESSQEEKLEDDIFHAKLCRVQIGSKGFSINPPKYASLKLNESTLILSKIPSPFDKKTLEFSVAPNDIKAFGIFTEEAPYVMAFQPKRKHEDSTVAEVFDPDELCIFIDCLIFAYSF